MKKNIIVLAVIVIVIAGALYFFINSNNKKISQNQESKPDELQSEIEAPKENIDAAGNNAAPLENKEEVRTDNEQNNEAVDKAEAVIGKSAGGKDIIAYHYGAGANEILLVGGIHGGYSWNTVSLAYKMADYFDSDQKSIPQNISVTIIPVLNPDGLAKVAGGAGKFNPADISSSADLQAAGRFNANNVDLNRNFDCNWKAQGIWRQKTVSGGTAAFSEPEAQAIRDYAKNHNLAGVVAWYSAAGGVFSSNCGSGILPETKAITDVYAKASGYPAHQDFDYYQVTGDMTNWFAKNNIPAIGVVLTSRDNAEWEKNLAGIKAIIEYYSK